MSKNLSVELKATIDRFEDGQAVLTFDFNVNNKRNLIVPMRYLPKNAKEGDELFFEVYTAQEEGDRKRDLAKKVLEEILKGE